VEVDGANQSVEGGPFLWTTHSDAVLEYMDDGPAAQVWIAHHTGYSRLDPALRHTRQVTLDHEAGVLVVIDTLTGSARHTARLAWHLGPEVSAALGHGGADLAWPGVSGPQGAVLQLPAELAWSAHRGETAPILGWYSPRFGERVPSTTLVGSGAWQGTLTLRTVLELSMPGELGDQEAANLPERATSRVSLGRRRVGFLGEQ
jgi:hypothetical protein